jgi:hypothetical protein
LSGEEEKALCELVEGDPPIKPVIQEGISMKSTPTPNVSSSHHNREAVQCLTEHRKIDKENNPLHIFKDSSATRKLIRMLAKAQQKDKLSHLFKGRDIRRSAQLNNAGNYPVVSLWYISNSICECSSKSVIFSYFK